MAHQNWSFWDRLRLVVFIAISFKTNYMRQQIGISWDFIYTGLILFLGTLAGTGLTESDPSLLLFALPAEFILVVDAFVSALVRVAHCMVNYSTRDYRALMQHSACLVLDALSSFPCVLLMILFSPHGYNTYLQVICVLRFVRLFDSGKLGAVKGLTWEEIESAIKREKRNSVLSLVPVDNEKIKTISSKPQKKQNDKNEKRKRKSKW